MLLRNIKEIYDAVKLTNHNLKAYVLVVTGKPCILYKQWRKVRKSGMFYSYGFMATCTALLHVRNYFEMRSFIRRT